MTKHANEPAPSAPRSSVLRPSTSPPAALRPAQRGFQWRELSQSRHVRVLFAISLIWLLPTLACGSFAPRPTPTPTTPADVQVLPVVGTEEPGAQAQVQATPVLALPTATPEPEATATFTPTPEPGTTIAVGQPARVIAPGGLNMRNAASTGGALIIQLGTGQRVDVLEGPTAADGYTWWRVDDGAGSVGWVVQGDGETEWLGPTTGGADPQPVNRPPRVGDRVVVNIQLSLRSQPGTSAALVSQIPGGSQFTVLAGPQPADGYNWYQLRSDDGALQGWAADGDPTDRWLSPLE